MEHSRRAAKDAEAAAAEEAADLLARVVYYVGLLFLGFPSPPLILDFGPIMKTILVLLEAMVYRETLVAKYWNLRKPTVFHVCSGVKAVHRVY